MIQRLDLEVRSSLGQMADKRKPEIHMAVLGNNAGLVNHATRTNWVYIRLHGDANRVVEAFADSGVPHEEGDANLAVAVQVIRRAGNDYYRVLNTMSNLYPASPWADQIGAHGEQHQRRDLGEGGRDPLDVYTRGLVNLRARAQVPAALTLYVERGFYFLNGTLREYVGGNSPAFTIPAGTPLFPGRRCDLLYMGADDALHVLEGTPVYDGSLPAYPTTPATCIPIAYVYMSSDMSSVSETYIKDARVILTASTAGAAAHDILSAQHSDTLAAAVAAGAVIIGNATPKWSSLALTVPAANVRNVLGVDNGDTLPSWKVALDATNPTTIGVSDAAAAGTSLVFSHRDHQHASPATFPATAHAASHQNGGGDEISVAGLSGVLGDAQTPIAHDILSAYHSDTLVGSIVDGDVLIGNVTPKLSRLAISIPAANVRNVFGIDNGELRPSWKTALDGTAAADIASAGAAGTSLVFAHRDHAHRGVVSVNKAGEATLYGAVTLSAGANVTLTQAAQNIEIAVAAAGAHDILSATHSDTLAAAVVAGDLVIGNDTPKWARLAISVPAAGILNYLGVNNAETKPSWKAASANPGAAAAVLQSNTSGALQLKALGINADPGSSIAIYVGFFTDTAVSTGLLVQTPDHTVDVSAELGDAGIVVAAANADIASGVSNTGSVRGFLSDVSINDVDFEGTLANQYAAYLIHGIDNAGASGERTVTNSYGLRIDRHATAGTITNSWGIYVDNSADRNYFAGNVGIAAAAWGTNAVGVLGIGNGTAPTTAPANMVQLWSADYAAGDARLYLRSEAGNNLILGNGAVIAAVDGSGGGLYAGASADVQLYRSAADTWRTPDSLTVDGGLNVGSATGAGTGQVCTSGAVYVTGTLPILTGGQISSLANNAAGTLFALPSTYSSGFLVVSAIDNNGNRQVAFFTVRMGSVLNEKEDTYDVFSVSQDTASHINVYVTGSNLTAQNKMGVTYTSIAAIFLGIAS